MTYVYIIRIFGLDHVRVDGPIDFFYESMQSLTTGISLNSGSLRELYLNDNRMVGCLGTCQHLQTYRSRDNMTEFLSCQPCVECPGSHAIKMFIEARKRSRIRTFHSLSEDGTTLRCAIDDDRYRKSSFGNVYNIMSSMNINPDYDEDMLLILTILYMFTGDQTIPKVQLACLDISSYLSLRSVSFCLSDYHPISIKHIYDAIQRHYFIKSVKFTFLHGNGNVDESDWCQNNMMNIIQHAKQHSFERRMVSLLS